MVEWILFCFHVIGMFLALSPVVLVTLAWIVVVVGAVWEIFKAVTNWLYGIIWRASLRRGCRLENEKWRG